MKIHLPIQGFVVVVLCLQLSCLTGCGKTPQLGGNEENATAADALWTAITSKRMPLVEQCASEIDRLHKAGTMPDDAYDALSEIVAASRASEWDDARDDLKHFLKGQRRPQP